MGDNNSDVIDGKAVTEVERLFWPPDSQIIPHMEKFNNVPLLDGYISVYKNNNRINNNYIDVIYTQVKGKTQEDSDFFEEIKYPIEKDLLMIANKYLGLVFFVVCMEASSFFPF